MQPSNCCLDTHKFPYEDGSYLKPSDDDDRHLSDL